MLQAHDRIDLPLPLMVEVAELAILGVFWGVLGTPLFLCVLGPDQFKIIGCSNFLTPIGRLVRTETPEANVYFNYLCGSKLASITKSGDGISYTYDGRLLTSEASSGSLNQAVSYSYNNDFARVQATYAGQATGYGYDNDGRYRGRTSENKLHGDYSLGQGISRSR